MNNVLTYFYEKHKIKSPIHLMWETPYIVKLEAAKPYPPGDNFLINIKEALQNASSGEDLYEYLELASKRNIFDYRMRKMDFLQSYMVPEYMLERARRNPMLEFKADENIIVFKYEQENTA